MDKPRAAADDPALLQELLGYLNFSNGASDPQFLARLNELYRRIEPAGVEQRNTRHEVRELLLARAEQLAAESATYRDVQQAKAVIDLAFDRLPTEYRKHHRDLLFHQPDAVL